MADLVPGTELSMAPADATVPCEFLCGIAGSGKTFFVREHALADPTWGLVCSTTGISAVNLDTVTINSTLRYFDTDSLRDIYLTGALTRCLRAVRESYRRLVIDEVSMMDGEQLSLIVRATLEVNSFRMDSPPLTIMCVGDFCQLPPVKARWAFESEEWHRFEAATTRLTKVWRQGLGPFLDALNHARRGDGLTAADILTHEGLEWHPALDTRFDGTTIVPRNDQVDRYNLLALDKLPSPKHTLRNRRWGRQRPEWSQIPPTLDLKEGAYVMLLSNRYAEELDGEREMLYANGDCGHVVSFNGDSVSVTLVRNGATVEVRRVCRDMGVRERPEGVVTKGEGGYWLSVPHWLQREKLWVEGQVDYWPLRLAYASTVHKVQGLSLDKIQLDIRDHFFSHPAMIYVGLSRCRTLGGLRVVGQRERFVRQCNIDERVRPWL